MKRLFILMFLANVVLTLISLAVLPERIAIHFGADGMADGWGSKFGNTAFMTFVQVLLFCTLLFSAGLMRALPVRWVNLPNKNYWLNPENRGRSLDTIQNFMWRFGVSIFLFLFVVNFLAFQANLAEPVRLNLKEFLPALAFLFAYTIWWTIMFFRAFRLPAQPAEGKG